MSDSDPLTIQLWKWEDEKSLKNNSGASTRDWVEESKRLNQVQALPLLSRTDFSSNVKSLRDVEMQQELWDYIMNMIWKLEKTNDKKSWQPVVANFRKLREGVYASNWSNRNYDFSVQEKPIKLLKVYEWSVNASLKAQDFDELFKSLRGLVDGLYILKKDSQKPFFTALYILYFCCCVKDKSMVMKQSARLDPNTKEAQFVRQLIRCVFVTKNSIEYFKLYQQTPYKPYKWLMEHHHEAIRIRAIKTLRKAYLSISLEWAKVWLGLENEVEVVPMINGLMQCIDRVDTEKKMVYFMKNKKTQPA